MTEIRQRKDIILNLSANIKLFCFVLIYSFWGRDWSGGRVKLKNKN